MSGRIPAPSLSLITRRSAFVPGTLNDLARKLDGFRQSRTGEGGVTLRYLGSLTLDVPVNDGLLLTTCRYYLPHALYIQYNIMFVHVVIYIYILYTCRYEVCT